MRYVLTVLLFLPTLIWGQGNQNVDEEMSKLAWQSGPSVGQIASKATINIPSGYLFLDEKNTSRFLELSGNPPRTGHYLLAPQSGKWWSVFSFSPSGYVKDDEKIDADALLKSLREGDAEGNEERKRLGMKAIFTDGWAVTPHYDEQTKRLEWGVRLKTEGGQFVTNYTARLLGRTGVMSAVLVTGVDTLLSDSQEFKTSLQQFSFNSGEKYSEFKQGDKIAEYGLAALILGGAAAVATKKGFWAVIAGFIAAFWKILVGFGIAAMAGLGKLFKSKKEQ